MIEIKYNFFTLHNTLLILKDRQYVKVKDDFPTTLR